MLHRSYGFPNLGALPILGSLIRPQYPARPRILQPYSLFLLLRLFLPRRLSSCIEDVFSAHLQLRNRATLPLKGRSFLENHILD